MKKLACALILILVTVVGVSDARELFASTTNSTTASSSSGTCLAPAEDVIIPPNSAPWAALTGKGQAVFYCENGTYDSGEGSLELTDPNGVWNGCFYYNPANGAATYRLINQITGELRIIEALSKVIARRPAADGNPIDSWRRKTLSDTGSPATAYITRTATKSTSTATYEKGQACDGEDGIIPYTATISFYDCKVTKTPVAADFKPFPYTPTTIPKEQCGDNGPVGTLYGGLPPGPPPPGLPQSPWPFGQPPAPVAPPPMAPRAGPPIQFIIAAPMPAQPLVVVPPELPVATAPAPSIIVPPSSAVKAAASSLAALGVVGMLLA